MAKKKPTRSHLDHALATMKDVVKECPKTRIFKRDVKTLNRLDAKHRTQTTCKKLGQWLKYELTPPSAMKGAEDFVPTFRRHKKQSDRTE